MTKRITAIGCIIVLLLVSVTGRVAYISLGKTYKVADTYNSININVSTLYSYIYSREGQKLNNNFKAYKAIILPDEKCISELGKLFDKEKTEEIREELKKGYPVVEDVSREYDTNYIDVIEVIKENSDKMPCRHMISKECGGLEYYTDEKLGSLSARYAVDALGRVLSGANGEIVSDNYDSREGIRISIDYDIQRIAEKAAKEMARGALVILDVNTSQVLASVSKGDDYINRSLSGYSVGSIFKLLICAAALEKGINPTYECKGNILVGDTKYHCLKGKKHGVQDMQKALENSCNCYFVNIALALGSDKIGSLAEKAGFCKGYELYNSWSVESSVFPDNNTLKSQGQLALLGFGQGKLTDNPVHFAAFVGAIANGGIYYSPSLSLDKREGEVIMSAETSMTLRRYMHSVVTEGTGRNADYNSQTAGKTATAQSGTYIDGREVLNTWFVGFYPYNNPKYSIVVMTENGQSGAVDCCPIFRTTVEMIDEMMYN
jgi:cell division protein FtsI/penicillin-binding protein 2